MTPTNQTVYIKEQLALLENNPKIDKFQYLYNIFKCITDDDLIIRDHHRFFQTCKSKAIQIYAEFDEHNKLKPQMNKDQLIFFEKAHEIIKLFIKKYAPEYKLQKKITIEDLPHKENDLSSIINNINFILMS